MFRRTLTALAVSLLTLSLPTAWGGGAAKEKAQQEAVARELKALEGFWVPVSLSAADGWGAAGKMAPGAAPQGGKGGKGGGKKGGKGGFPGVLAAQLPAARLPAESLRIRGKEYALLTLGTGQAREKGLLLPDPSQSPKALDLIATEGPNERTVYHAIYELKGDALRICFGEPRPTDFTPGPNGDQRLMTYRKLKVDVEAILGGARPGGPRFQYNLLTEIEIRLLDPSDELDLERGLNRLGEAGWEMVSAERATGQLFFKRAR